MDEEFGSSQEKSKRQIEGQSVQKIKNLQGFYLLNRRAGGPHKPPAKGKSIRCL